MIKLFKKLIKRIISYYQIKKLQTLQHKMGLGNYIKYPEKLKLNEYFFWRSQDDIVSELWVIQSLPIPDGTIFYIDMKRDKK